MTRREGISPPNFAEIPSFLANLRDEQLLGLSQTITDPSRLEETREAHDLTLAFLEGFVTEDEFFQVFRAQAYGLGENGSPLKIATIIGNLLYFVEAPKPEAQKYRFQSRRALIEIGNTLQEIACVNFEKGLFALGFVFGPLESEDPNVRRRFARLYQTLRQGADSDEKKLCLHLFTLKALTGRDINQGVTKQEGRRMRDDSRKEIGKLIDKIGRFQPKNREILPSMLALLAGAAHYGDLISFLDRQSLLGFGQDALFNGSSSRGLKDLADAKLEVLFRQISHLGEAQVINFGYVLTEAAAQSTTDTTFSLGTFLCSGDKLKGLDSPLDCMLRSASGPSSLKQVAIATLGRILKQGEQIRVRAKGGIFGTLESFIVDHIFRKGDYQLGEKKVFLETFLATRECSLPKNWQDLLAVIEITIGAGGQFIIWVEKKIPYLFARTDQPVAEQLAQLAGAFQEERVEEMALAVGEYPEERVWPSEGIQIIEVGDTEPLLDVRPSGGAVVQEPVVQLVEGAKQLRGAVMARKETLTRDLEDDPQLPSRERIERFLKRLLAQGVLEEMDEDEALEMLGAAEKRWGEIYPKHQANRTHSFALGGTNYHLKARQHKLTRARLNDLPRLSLYHPPFETKGPFSDVYVDLQITKDLCLRLALNRKGDLVLLEKGEQEQEFFELLNSDPYASNYFKEQLEVLIINNAHHALKTEDKVLSARARSVVTRALDVLTGRKKIASSRSVPSRKKARRKPSLISSLELTDVTVVVYNAEDESPYPSDESFMQALQSGKVIVEESVLSEREILGMRRHYGRGGYRIPKEVRGLGDRGGIVWLPLMEEITGEVDEDDNVSIKLKPKVPTFAARVCAESRGVPLRKADIWIIDENGEPHCLTVYSTFRRSSVTQEEKDTRLDEDEDRQQ